ncbi:hypothetical protein AAG747_04265 [Rapidithrix thailandica]|uniref:Uncharacterized protein n=1 Tax=Rapidithrix thailandica TaxID=413964 RepID=A0AAW9RQD3_9BACT
MRTKQQIDKQLRYLLISLPSVLGWHFMLAQPISSMATLQTTLLNPASKTVMVAAHRAAHLKYPENSLMAIEHAITLGGGYCGTGCAINQGQGACDFA